jgi:hypothetical protein
MEESDRMRTLLQSTKFANENEKPAEEEKPTQGRTYNEHASPTAARDRGCVCVVWELEGARLTGDTST